MKFVSTILALTFGVANCAPDTDKLLFAFEVVRHGARSPTTSSAGFAVPAGELTASGMRQRFLLGSLHRDRYTKQYDLLDPDYVPGQVYVESTVYDRTF